MFHHIKIWTLSESQYEQWKKIGFAKFVFEKEIYQLENGISKFLRKNDDDCQWWMITILPELFLEYKGNLYALVAVDYENPRTANFRTSFFCKLGIDGFLHPIHKYEEQYLSTMKVTDKDIVFYEWGEYPQEPIPLSDL